MIELFEQDVMEFDRHSSKGNQLKWQKDSQWYKADYLGYEGLAEYMVSHLLEKSSLAKSEFVSYELEQIKYNRQVFNGAKSPDILDGDWQIITLERAYKNTYGKSLTEMVWHIPDVEERLKLLVSSVERMTGISDFGIYMSKLLTIDAFFKNEDRHMHNIALLMSGKEEYKLCPIFDNGGSLLSDTKLDYPLGADVFELMDEVKAKTISKDFDEQMDAAEALYGEQIKFFFTRRDVDELLKDASQYSKAEIERVRTILYQQIRKYL